MNVCTFPQFAKRAALTILFMLRVRASLAADVAYEKSIEGFLHETFDHGDVGMVVALVDNDGTRLFSAGKQGNGTDKAVDADTSFEIGSCTKTFTALLLQEIAHRGEVKLGDPVARYLPPTVKVPSRNKGTTGMSASTSSTERATKTNGN
jgi:CubicO group peptidase (beta-lactamase class C family)